MMRFDPLIVPTNESVSTCGVKPPGIVTVIDCDPVVVKFDAADTVQPTPPGSAEPMATVPVNPES